MSITTENLYCESGGGLKYRTDYKEKKVFQIFNGVEKEIPNTTRSYRKAVVYGFSLTESEYRASLKKSSF